MIPQKKYANVAPAIPLPQTGRQLFTYRVPEEVQIERYSVVEIPVGRRTVRGVVMDVHDIKPSYPTKPIRRSLGYVLTKEQVQFADWIARTMQGGLGFTMRLFFAPAAVKKKEIVAVAPHKRKPTAKTHTFKQELVKARQAILIEKDVKKRSKEVLDIAWTYVQEGQQVLMLVPEIWLAEAIYEQVKQRDRKNVFLYHTQFKASERGLAWQALQAGMPTIVIGTQKALFLPFKKLGLVVLEEEQYGSHKLWDQYPRLYNRRGVEVLRELHRADVLYTSSFPSLYIQQDKAHHSTPVLADNPIAMRTETIQLSFEDRREKRFLPEEFTVRLKALNKKKENILLFYNQRGAWQAARCRTCRQLVECPECRVSLAVHGGKQSRELVCHVCGYAEPLPKTCPHCHKGALQFVGIGTQTVEKILAQLGSIKKDMVRLDADTVASGQRVANKRIVLATTAILTQAEPQQFDHVVWLFPERSFQYPDFRSYERGLLLLARLQQLVKKKRPVILVTRQHRALEDVVGASVEKLYEKQLKERKRLSYPPITDLVRLSVTGKTDEEAMQKATKLREVITKRLGGNKTKEQVAIRGPFEAFQGARRGRPEVHVVLSGPLSHLVELYDGLNFDTADVDPQRVL